jgi:protein Tex
MPSAPITLSAHLITHIASKLKLLVHNVVATITLLDEGGTVPFIARYRKEATGNLDEVAIAAILEETTYFRELEERRDVVLSSIREQGKLTDELEKQINGAMDKSALEDLYLPYRPKRRTKATIAKEKGLEPLAQYLWTQTEAPSSLNDFATTFINPELGVATVEEALEGARHIIAEQISETAEIRAGLRQRMLSDGMVNSRKIEDANDPEGKFKMYYEYSESAAKIPSHRMLAIRRGSEENILYFQIELPSEWSVNYIKSQVIKRPGDWLTQLEQAAEDAWKRLLNLSIQTEVRLVLKERSDAEAIRVFRENLQNVLLSAPAGMIGTIGLDPGLRTGCKIAVVDQTSKFLENSVIYPLEPKKDIEGSRRILADLVRKYNVRAIAVGNGTGSREAMEFVQDFLRDAGLHETFGAVVNESGASIYSASEIARSEFPDLDLTVRGAISIARRLQDPLSELVKIDPKSIGVGQYQHDVDQKRLGQALDSTVEACVNRVGVDLNTASFALLRYVSGINERTAKSIVSFRDEKGAFRSRLQLTQVSGFGAKTFEQAAGFLRIRNAENPLDSTAVHPESYAIVEKMAKSLTVEVSDLISKPGLIDQVRLEEFQTEKAGMYTLSDIREELKKPGRDPRAQFVAPKFQSGIREISDLQADMVLEGTVTNVTNFGAFVDVGVHQDGLVHVGELANHFVKDPYSIVRVGQIVKVKVLGVDIKARRISLSMKALQESALPKIKNAPAPRRDQQIKSVRPQTMEDKLQALSNKFRNR